VVAGSLDTGFGCCQRGIYGPACARDEQSKGPSGRGAVDTGEEVRSNSSGGRIARKDREASMNEDALNVSVRKFLKVVGVTSQREIEKAVREAAARGQLQPNDKLAARMTLQVAGIDLTFEVEGEIEVD
jgi:Family of unknown function (DUF6494)